MASGPQLAILRMPAVQARRPLQAHSNGIPIVWLFEQKCSKISASEKVANSSRFGLYTSRFRPSHSSSLNTGRDFQNHSAFRTTSHLLSVLNDEVAFLLRFPQFGCIMIKIKCQAVGKGTNTHRGATSCENERKLRPHSPSHAESSTKSNPDKHI